MCPLKHEQARRETQQWVMRHLPIAGSIVEIGRKSRSWIKNLNNIQIKLAQNNQTCNILYQEYEVRSWG